MMLPTLSGYELVFHCPAVDENARCSLRFMRTLRIPDDGKDYPLPPGIGDFELVPVGEHAGRVPAAWRQQGGYRNYAGAFGVFPAHAGMNRASWARSRCWGVFPAHAGMNRNRG